MSRSGPARTIVAAGLTAASLAALLVAWFLSGWADVRTRQRELRTAPEKQAAQRGAELARELRSELAQVIAREVERPYFQYQNLMHDPRAGGNLNVTPSPLAAGSEDPFILGYFQLDSAGRVTIPTINDDVPDLSEPQHLAGNRRFRDEVIRSISTSLAPGKRPLVATSEPRPADIDRQVQRYDRYDNNSWVQNSNSNMVYRQQQAQEPRAPAVVTPTAAAADGPVTITISSLEWHTLPYAGAPALVASRTVETPEGTLAQGFVVDRSTVTSWLAGHAGDAVAELRTDASHADLATEVAPGWYLDLAPNPRTLGEAITDATGIARSFLLRFILVGVVALIAGTLVVLLVARAEALARERSQFAAAAAHELRTPLAGLQLYGDMIADGLGDPSKVRDYARRMSEEASRLGRVVSNVLGFSQLERGNLSVDPQAASLADALRELAQRAEPALDRAGAALELDVPPALEARFDRDALARIVGNLLDNAEKYGRAAGDRTIGLAARPTGTGVEVVVTDHGPGVAQPARLFVPFTRGVDADGPAGLGLGLALSQSLARAMGGDLDYRTAPGGGAAFVLRLVGA